jgi:tripartite-type tricarboxylate transporter receptor subunit TctC
MDPRRAPKRNRREKPIMIRIAALLAAILLLTSSEARAQTYPARSITLIVPFAAGGSNDMIGRIIGKKLSETWGQPVVIDNRPGAGGVIGTSAVAASAPDGYTTRSRTSHRAPFIARSPLLLVASNKLVVKSASELLALAKSKPGQITYASAGPGSINQIAAELVALSAGASFTHVPYKGDRLRSIM